jgi:hypothetical protein
MKRRFWALARNGIHLWWLLDDRACFVTNAGRWYEVKRFRTRTQAEGWEFFIRMKHPDAFENITLQIVRIEVLYGMMMVVKS